MSQMFSQGSGEPYLAPDGLDTEAFLRLGFAFGMFEENTVFIPERIA